MATIDTIAVPPFVPITRDRLLDTAAGLLGDGRGNEWGDNTEYTRAITELVSDLLGYTEEERDQVLAQLRSRFTYEGKHRT